MQLRVRLDIRTPVSPNTLQDIAVAFSRVAKEFQILVGENIFVIFIPKKKVVDVPGYLEELFQVINASKPYWRPIEINLEGIKYDKEDVDSLLTFKVCEEIKGGE